MSYNLSGNCGAPGATVSWSGTSSGSTTADGSGNFSATGVLTSGGNYYVTPTLAGYNFSPTSSYWPNVSGNLTGITFTATAIPNAKVVQKAVQINTTGGDTATATFAKALTAGNGLIVAVVAVDTGGAIGSDEQGVGEGAGSYASVTDSQSNSLVTSGNGINIYGDRTNGKTFLVGIYYLNISGTGGVKAGSDAVTFTFTPISTAAKCVVGLVAYEVQGFYNYNASFIGTPNDTASTNSGAAYPGAFPPRVVGDITVVGATYGSFVVVCAAATTSDGSAFTVGSEKGSGSLGELGWTLDGSQAAHVNGTYVTLAVQSEFETGTNGDNPVEFGSTPSSGDGIASVAAALSFGLGNTPAANPDGGNYDTDNPALPFLGSISLASSGSQVPAKYIGHVRILTSAPSRAPNPYLGEVYIVASVPAGATDPFLGEVAVVANPPSGQVAVPLGQMTEAE